MFGFNQGELFLKNNSHKYELCCMQEHWLYPSTLNDLANFNPDFAYHAVSQMPNDDLLSQGRPHDGLAVFWKKKFSLIVHYVGSSPNNRVMALVVECIDENICLFNVYLHCFDNSVIYLQDLLECFSYIELIVKQINDEYENVKICIIGDFNFDCARLFKHENLKSVREFMTEYSTSVVTETLESRGEFSFSKETLGLYSMIDHCMLDNELVCKLCDVLLIYVVENFSDHKPLLVTLKCSFRNIIDASGVNNTYAMWNNETKRAYYTNICYKLYEIDLYNCKCQGMCVDSNHCAYIDNYCDNIVRALCDSTVWGDNASGDYVNRSFK